MAKTTTNADIKRKCEQQLEALDARSGEVGKKTDQL
jgi:hypothetical protein